MNPVQKFQQLFEDMYQLCEEQGWGDPFSYSRAREIHLASILGHEVANTYYGADAYEVNGVNRKPIEYKTTISKTINATYNGVSVQSTWENQEDYLVEDKLGKYHNHYIARYSGAKIVEIWRLSSDDVLMLLLPKLKRDWERKIAGNHKDPRLSATITNNEIYKYGTRLNGVR